MRTNSSSFLFLHPNSIAKLKNRALRMNEFAHKIVTAHLTSRGLKISEKQFAELTVFLLNIYDLYKGDSNALETAARMWLDAPGRTESS